MTQKQRFSKPIKKTLAEQVAETIKESILAGEWQGGEALPTEPELSEQFGVSRAVVRDATRMLVARGLVEAQHGRGVFVTESQTEAFGEALLLALRRAGATVWDVEHFEQLIYPELFALAAKEATEDEIEAIREALDHYLDVTGAMYKRYWGEKMLPSEEQKLLEASYRDLIRLIFKASHNRVLELLSDPLLRLRSVRNWENEGFTPEKLLKQERTYFMMLVDALASGDPDEARNTLQKLMRLPAEAREVMQRTPIGKVPIIPIALPTRILDPTEL